MQPQNNPTGYNQPPSAGHGIPPVPEQPGVPSVTPIVPPIQRPPAANQTALSAQGAVSESWVQEVERICADTAQNPHARAKALADVKKRYQQQVLGIKGRDGAG